MRSTGIPNAVLRGEPSLSDLGDARTTYVDEPQSSVKLPFDDRYEHFVATDEVLTVRGMVLRVFQWSHTTYVAE